MRYFFRIACALIAASVIAAPAKPPNSIHSEGEGPQFRCQLSQRLGSEPDTLHLVVAVSVPYDNLVFERADSGFAAAFELAASVFRNDSLIAEKITWPIARTMAYTETNSREKNAANVNEFRLPSGNYRVLVVLTARDESHRKSHWAGTIALEQSDPLLRLSDIYWMSEDKQLTVLGVPRVTETFTNNDPDPVARIQLFSMGTDNILLTWTLTGERGDTIFTRAQFITPAHETQTADDTLRLKSLRTQRYALWVEARGNGRRETRALRFNVRSPGIPLSVTDLDQAIRQLKYIATHEEYEKLRAAQPQDREIAFRDFWKKQAQLHHADEGDMMEEYYRRVQYANEHFRTHREGWDTDRGRIYITYGEPTDIERHPFEPGSYPYEIWFYAEINKRFMFVDNTGFGDYNLVTPEWGY
jgi:GWxTD domain-containing protein